MGGECGRAAAPPTGGREVNSHAALRVIRPINLAGEGEKARSTSPGRRFGQLRVGGAWQTRADIKQTLVVPAHIVSAQLRPGVVVNFAALTGHARC